MKFIESFEPVTKIWLDESDGAECICIEIDNHITVELTPLEAQQLAEILQKKCKDTDYFKGLKAAQLVGCGRCSQ